MRRPAGDDERAPERDWGWVVLLVLTACGIVAALLASSDGRGEGTPGEGAAGRGTTSASSTPAPTSSPGAALSSPTRPSSTSGDEVVTGTGRLAYVPVTARHSARTGRVVRWTLESEGGLGIDLEDYARTVVRTLEDSRGWQGKADVRFVHVPATRARAGVPVDVRITLASPRLTDRLCAPLDTGGEVSCWQRGRAVLNAQRWVAGAPSYRGRVGDYRTYLVNHEVGHGLGYGHEDCQGGGRRAPVMLQQTVGLGGCTAWPYPKGDGSTLR